MPIVCTYKPNRKNPRPFRAKDIARIAGYAADDGTPWLKIVASVVVAAGLGVLFCNLASKLNSVRQLTQAVASFGAGLALAELIDRLIKYLSYGLLRKLPFVRALLLGLAALAAFLAAIEKPIQELIDDAFDVQEAIDIIDSICGYIHEVG